MLLSKGLSWILFLIGIGWLTSANAYYDTLIKVSGEVIIPPCILNNGDPIEVHFERLSTVKVNGQNYKKTIDIPLICEFYQATPYITIRGTKLNSSESNVLATQLDNFGIALYQGKSISKGTEINVDNTPIQITDGLHLNDGQGVFSLTLVPMKVADIYAGSFSASAEVAIFYE